jgi:hypothetical protein
VVVEIDVQSGPGFSKTLLSILYFNHFGFTVNLFERHSGQLCAPFQPAEMPVSMAPQNDEPSINRDAIKEKTALERQ